MSKEGIAKPEGFLDLLKGMTAEEVCAVNPNVAPISGTPIDEVVEAIDSATRETDVPSAVREKFIAVAKDGGDQVAGLLSLMRATIPGVAKEADHQKTLAAKLLEVAEKFGVTLPEIVAKEAKGDDEEEAAAADDAEKDKGDDSDDSDSDAEESAAMKKADEANDRLDRREALDELDEATESIGIAAVRKLVRAEVTEAIKAGSVKPGKVQDAVNEAVQRSKRAAEAHGAGSAFDGLEPSDMGIDLVAADASRTTEAQGEPSPGEAAFYDW